MHRLRPLAPEPGPVAPSPSRAPQIAAKERVLGFYTTGTRIRPADLHMDALFRARGYCAHPLLVIVDVRPGVEGLPIQAFVTQEEVTAGGRDIARTFAHVPSEVGAFEAEEGEWRWAVVAWARTRDRPGALVDDEEAIYKELLRF